MDQKKESMEIYMSNEKNNIWYLNELSYKGKLYHYTDNKGYKGIFGENSDDNITLRFTRIDCLKDKQERRNIRETVKNIAKQLKNENLISEEFYSKLYNYEPTNCGLTTSITDTYNQETRNNTISIKYGKVDYYIACFSTNSNNRYIINEMNCTKRINFDSSFSNISNPQRIEERKLGFLNSIFNYDDFDPCKSFQSCFLDYYMRRVLYNDQEKEKLIKKCLIEISNDKSNFPSNLEQMYYLFDGFFKCKNFEKEEEVRLLVKVSKKDTDIKEFKKNNILFADDEDNNIPKKYLYIPIDSVFLENDSVTDIENT